MKVIHPSFRVVLLVAFAAGLVSCASNQSDQISSSNRVKLSQADSLSQSRSTMQVYKDAAKLVDSKVEETQKSSRKMNISLPDIITYFMSSF